MKNTRDKLIKAAIEHFADRGFYGASVAQISDELGLSKQALLHHFGSKETLYGDVLQTLSQELMQSLNACLNNDQTLAKPELLFSTLCCDCLSKPTMTQLLVRELLDNKRRAEFAKQWYLQGFLDALTHAILEDPRAKGLTKLEALSIVYQLLGAINYFAISKPTLAQIYSPQTHAEMEQAYQQEIILLIKTRLDAITN